MRSPASAARRRRRSSRSASTSSAGSATRWSSCSPASTSRRRPSGCARSSTPSLDRELGHLVDGRAPGAGRRDRGGGVLPAPVHGEGRAAASRSARRSPGAAVELALGVVPRVHDDRPARPGVAVRRLPRRRTSTARPSRTPSCTRTGPARWSPTPPRSAAAETTEHGRRPSPYPAPSRRLTRRMPLGTSCTRAPATRAATPTSGCGSRTRRPGRRDERPRRTWLTKLIDPEEGPRAGARGGRPRRSRSSCCPTSARVNVLIHGLLGEGVAASHPVRPAGQGARRVGAVAAWSRIPEELL